MMVEDAGEAMMAVSYTMFTTLGLAYPGALVELNCATRGWLPIISEEASNCLTSWYGTRANLSSADSRLRYLASTLYSRWA